MYFSHSDHDFELKRIEEENHIVVDNIEYQTARHRVNFVVYDTITETIVDVFGIDMDGEYTLKHSKIKK